MTALDQFIAKLVSVIVNPLITLLFAAATVLFLWGVFEYIRDGESSDGREKGKTHIIWGLIGMTIMFGAQKIIYIAMNTIYG